MVKKKKHGKKNGNSRLRIKIMLVALFPMILMAVIVGITAARNMREGMQQEMMYALETEAHSLEQLYNAVNDDAYLWRYPYGNNPEGSVREASYRYQGR